MVRVLYLDYDGTLHPDDVFLVRGRPVLRVEGAALFEWTTLLIEALTAHPCVTVVLSTSWVRAKRSFSWAKSWLPRELQRRVVGATWHSDLLADNRGRDPFERLTRYEQIAQDAARRGLCRWLALDNDDEGWPRNMRHHLVHCHPDLGLGEPGKAQELRQRLGWLTSQEPQR